jgi:hypothetical protein
MYAFWRQRPQQLQRVALQNSAFHHSTSSFSSSYNSLKRLFHILSPKKQYTPNTIHSPLAMFCNKFSITLPPASKTFDDKTDNASRHQLIDMGSGYPVPSDKSLTHHPQKLWH